MYVKYSSLQGQRYDHIAVMYSIKSNIFLNKKLDNSCRICYTYSVNDIGKYCAAQLSRSYSFCLYSFQSKIFRPSRDHVGFRVFSGVNATRTAGRMPISGISRDIFYRGNFCCFFIDCVYAPLAAKRFYFMSWLLYNRGSESIGSVLCFAKRRSTTNL